LPAYGASFSKNVTNKTMKKLSHILYVVISCIVLTSTSCTHDTNLNAAPANTTGSSGTGSNAQTPGSGWRVTLFSETSENKTSHFSGYQFDFAANGTISATGNGQTVTGAWSQYQDDGVTKLAISLNTTDKDLSELNDDWVLISKSDTFISLKDDNSAKNEQLQFSK
jgi:hypothetical protein